MTTSERTAVNKLTTRADTAGATLRVESDRPSAGAEIDGRYRRALALDPINEELAANLARLSISSATEQACCAFVLL
jgi:hypothetical protein